MITADEVKKRLAQHRRELEALGVSSLELFGSLVRGVNNAGSDIDLLVRFERPVSLFEFYEVEEYLEKLFDTDRIDLVMREAVFEELRDGIYSEAVPCL
ncbi:MAG: nucleotidyltransferase family protein [Candidatus Hydrogenedentes bacterium]|nr:nucleotidyltransferase family protein [Candidatus Hydrogenedentota bacterium]